MTEMVGELELVPCDGERDGALIRALTRENFRALLGDRWDEARHLQQPDHPEQYRMVRRAGETIGFFATRLDGDALYVQTIQLVASARGRGVGTALLAHVAELARRGGFRLLRLRVLHGNERALGLYLRLGYVVVADEAHARVLELAVASSA